MWPHLPAHMRVPVTVYTTVITGMLVCAGTRWGEPGYAVIVAGAVGFAISDLAVARRQFFPGGRSAALWGTPLYFSSQMLLAASVALA